MPQSLAQFMGVLVTVLIVFGSDLDVLIAVPLGIFAGVLAYTLASIPRAMPRMKSVLRRRPPANRYLRD